MINFQFNDFSQVSVCQLYTLKKQENFYLFVKDFLLYHKAVERERVHFVNYQLCVIWRGNFPYYTAFPPKYVYMYINIIVTQQKFGDFTDLNCWRINKQFANILRLSIRILPAQVLEFSYGITIGIGTIHFDYENSVCGSLEFIIRFSSFIWKFFNINFMFIHIYEYRYNNI